MRRLQLNIFNRDNSHRAESLGVAIHPFPEEVPVAPREKAPTAVTVKKRGSRKTTAATAELTPALPGFVDPERRMALIAEAAYFRAERRGFAPGGERSDWLAAEAEVDAKLMRATTIAPRV